MSIKLTGGLADPVVWTSTTLDAWDAGDAVNLTTLHMRLYHAEALAACENVDMQVSMLDKVDS